LEGIEWRGKDMENVNSFFECKSYICYFVYEITNSIDKVQELSVESFMFFRNERHVFVFDDEV
jgi:hypothetical protein